MVLCLPWEVHPLFRQWLEAHFPERVQRVMNRVREMHGGKDYDCSFGAHGHAEGGWADLVPPFPPPDNHASGTPHRALGD